jgi:hypothetical protein
VEFFLDTGKPRWLEHAPAPLFISANRLADYKRRGDDMPHLLISADSQAWSSSARKRQYRRPGCTHPNDCRNCLTWALEWRQNVLADLAAGPGYHQGTLDLFAA